MVDCRRRISGHLGKIKMSISPAIHCKPEFREPEDLKSTFFESRTFSNKLTLITFRDSFAACKVTALIICWYLETWRTTNEFRKLGFATKTERSSANDQRTETYVPKNRALTRSKVFDSWREHWTWWTRDFRNFVRFYWVSEATTKIAMEHGIHDIFRFITKDICWVRLASEFSQPFKNMCELEVVPSRIPTRLSNSSVWEMSTATWFHSSPPK